MNNEQILFPIFKELYNKLQNNDIVIDKSGSKLVEIVACKIDNLNPIQNILDFVIKKTNEEYCKKELKWYLSQDLNINGWVDDIKIWKDVADKDGYINSNYGWCCFSYGNYNQYENCLNTLIKHKESRQSIMIYNRPSMHYDSVYNGARDFMCCQNNEFLIRNNKLISIVQFRSQDLVYGFFNDFYWKCFIYNKLYVDLLNTYPDLQIGNIIWISNSMHCYERHFNLLTKIVEENATKFK